MTQRNFDIALKKGNIGEAIVKAHLERYGWCVFQPTSEGAHSFDMLCIKDKKKAIALDVKAKARMTHIHGTGIDQRHFVEYMEFSQKHCMPFYLAFVDESTGQIYGNSLHKLEEGYTEGQHYYPRMVGKQRIWNLHQMNFIANIPKEKIDELKKYSQRNYEYST